MMESNGQPLSRRKLLIGGTLVVGAASLASLGAACAPPVAAPTQAPGEAPSTAPRSKATDAAKPAASTAKATITVGIGAEPNVLNDLANREQNGRDITGALYEPLMVPNPNTGDLDPVLATSWKSTSPTVWQFKIREGVKFHNGEPMTAEAARFSIETLRTFQKNTLNQAVGEVASTEVVDEHTLNVTTKAPSGIFLGNISQVPMFPPKYYAQVGDQGFSDRPVGTGPFKFKEWRRGQYVALDGFEGHWKTRPILSNVVYRFVPETATKIAALQTGEIDLATLIDVDQADGLKARGFAVQTTTLGEGWAIMFVPRPNNGLGDVRVRQAINYGINREAILKNVLKDATKTLNGQTVGPDGFGYNPNLKPWPHDLERAKSLLREAGFPSGLDLEFEVAPPTLGAKTKEIAEAIAEQLGQAGINVRIKFVEFAVFLADLQNDKLQAMTTFSNFYNTTWDADHAIRVVSTQTSSIIFRDPKIDEFLKAERAELDQVKRKKILQDAVAYLREIAVDAPLFLGFAVYASNPKLKGFAPTPDRVVHLEQARFEP